jgi:precorrin-6Y C5,15-methyltransferase (decarboxylating)
MTDSLWLTIIGLHEDGLEALSSAAVICLKNADVIMAPPRHLAHLEKHALSAALKSGVSIISWPVPYDTGIKQLLAMRGRQVVVLASGDPFHYGAGTSITRHLAAGEWQCFPAPSSFSMIASALGWPVETTHQIGLHASAVETLRPMLANNARLIVLLRDSASMKTLADYLASQGFEHSICYIFSKLSTTKNSFIRLRVADIADQQFDTPIAVGLELASDGDAMMLASGKPDQLFAHDGQITKQLIRAITLSALAPCPDQHLVDIGSGSGSVACEWMLTHPSLTATAIEIRADRAEHIAHNAKQFGLDRLAVITGDISDHLERLDNADTVFIGGGLTAELLQAVWHRLAIGGRLVINAVTAESEALVISAHNQFGGTVTKIELSDLMPIGRKHGWKSRYPIVQWVAIKLGPEACQ